MKYKIKYLTAFIALNCLFQTDNLTAMQPIVTPKNALDALNSALASGDALTLRNIINHVIATSPDPVKNHEKIKTILNQALQAAGIPAADPSNPFHVANAVAAAVPAPAIQAAQQVNIPAVVGNAVNPALLEFEKFFRNLSPAEQAEVVSGGNLQGANEQDFHQAFLRRKLAKEAAAEARNHNPQANPGFVTGVPAPINPAAPAPINPAAPAPINPKAPVVDKVIDSGQAVLEPRLIEIYKKHLSTANDQSTLGKGRQWNKFIRAALHPKSGETSNATMNTKILDYIEIALQVTYAFTLKMINPADDNMEALERAILSATREISEKIYTDDAAYNKEMSRVKALLAKPADDKMLDDLERLKKQTKLFQLLNTINNIKTSSEPKKIASIDSTISGIGGDLKGTIHQTIVLTNRIISSINDLGDIVIGLRNISNEIKSIYSQMKILESEYNDLLQVQNKIIDKMKTADEFKEIFKKDIETTIDGINRTINAEYDIIEKSIQNTSPENLAAAWKKAYDNHAAAFQNVTQSFTDALAELRSLQKSGKAELDSKNEQVETQNTIFRESLCKVLSIIEIPIEEPLCHDSVDPHQMIKCDINNENHIEEYMYTIRQSVIDTNNYAKTISDKIKSRIVQYADLIADRLQLGALSAANLNKYHLLVSGSKNIDKDDQSDEFRAFYDNIIEKIKTGIRPTSFTPTTSTNAKECIASNSVASFNGYEILSYGKPLLKKEPHTDTPISIVAGVALEPKKKRMGGETGRIIRSNSTKNYDLSIFAPIVANPEKDIIILPQKRSGNIICLYNPMPLYKIEANKMEEKLGSKFNVLKHHLKYLMYRLDMPNYEDALTQPEDTTIKQINARQTICLANGAKDPQDYAEQNGLYIIGEIHKETYDKKNQISTISKASNDALIYIKALVTNTK